MTHLERRELLFQRTNSIIFAPFMINVVCELLNRHNSHNLGTRVNTHEYIGNWGGGKYQLLSCFPQWDSLVSECCQQTPIGHHIWRRFAQRHQLPDRIQGDGVRVLQYLLQQWARCGQESNLIGPYPSFKEQEDYQQIEKVQRPFAVLQDAILTMKFEPAFKANGEDIDSLLLRRRRQSKAAAQPRAVGR